MKVILDDAVKMGRMALQEILDKANSASLARQSATDKPPEPSQSQPPLAQVSKRATTSKPRGKAGWTRGPDGKPQTTQKQTQKRKRVHFLCVVAST